MAQGRASSVWRRIEHLRSLDNSTFDGAVGICTDSRWDPGELVVAGGATSNDSTPSRSRSVMAGYARSAVTSSTQPSSTRMCDQHHSITCCPSRKEASISNQMCRPLTSRATQAKVTESYPPSEAAAVWASRTSRCYCSNSSRPPERGVTNPEVRPHCPIRTSNKRGCKPALAFSLAVMHCLSTQRQASP